MPSNVRRGLNEKFGSDYDNSKLVHLFTLYYTMRTQRPK